MNETIQKINAVLNSLNGIEVRGYNNLNALLACMQMLEEIRGDLQKDEVSDNG